MPADRYDCALCRAVFTPEPGASLAFCAPCRASMRHQTAAIAERRERIARGDLGVLNDEHAEGERMAVLQARAGSNRSAIIRDGG